MPIGVDWLYNIAPAVHVFMQGGNPYDAAEGFQRAAFPFWTFLLLSPFALLPYWIGRTLLFLVSMVLFAYTAIRMGATREQLLMFLCSSAVLGCLNNGNLDWLVTVGLWLPPWLGLFFVMMKPQVGLLLAMYWGYMTWRWQGWKALLKLFLPVTIGYLLSFALYGNWIMSQFDNMQSNPENMAAFPWVVPFAVWLMWTAVRTMDRRLPVLAGPMVAPYVSQFSYAACLLALLNRPRLFVLAWILLWIPVAVRYLI